MAAEMQDHPMYRHASLISAAKGRALLDLYGAHGLSIEWLPGRAEPTVGLVFYIEADRTGAHGSLLVPEEIRVVAEDGGVVAVPTRVVTAPMDTYQ
jgi:hypothetical protein